MGIAVPLLSSRNGSGPHRRGWRWSRAGDQGQDPEEYRGAEVRGQRVKCSESLNTMKREKWFGFVTMKDVGDADVSGGMEGTAPWSG